MTSPGSIITPQPGWWVRTNRIGTASGVYGWAATVSGGAPTSITEAVPAMTATGAFVLPGVSASNPTFDAIGAGNSETASSATITATHTCTGNAVLCYVGCIINSVSTNVTVTYGGVPMTMLGSPVLMATISGSGDYYFMVFSLLSPPSGAQTVSVHPASGGTYLAFNTVSYANVGSFGTPVTNTAQNNSLTLTASSATGHLLSQSFFIDAAGASITGYNQTQRYNGAPGSWGAPLLIGGAAGASSVTFTASTTGGNYWAGIAVDLLPLINQSVGAQTMVGSAAMTVPTVTPTDIIAPPVMPGSSTMPTPTISADDAMAPPVMAGSAAMTVPTVAAIDTAAPPAMSGSSTMPAPAISVVENLAPPAMAGSSQMPAPILSTGTNASVSAAVGVGSSSMPAPTVTATNFTPFSETNTARTNQAVPTGCSGCYVTLIGAGGAGGSAGGGVSNDAGTGGGGGARVNRIWIPITSGTYSVSVGTGGAPVATGSAPPQAGSGTASTFSTSTGVSLSAGGGAGGVTNNSETTTGANGGTYSITGATGTGQNGTAGGGYVNTSTYAGKAGVSDTVDDVGCGGGGGAGGGHGGAGGNSNNATGGAGGTSGSPPGGTPASAGAGHGGAGGGGGYASNAAGGQGGLYGGGGGGGGDGGPGVFGQGGAGGAGYTLVEWQ